MASVIKNDNRSFLSNNKNAQLDRLPDYASD